MKKHGFTLIELLVVVLIIGILAAIALPMYQTAVEKSRTAEAFINLKALGTAAQAYYMESGAWPTTFDELSVSFGKNCTSSECAGSGFCFSLGNMAGVGAATPAGVYQLSAYRGPCPIVGRPIAIGFMLADYAPWGMQKGDIQCFTRNTALYEKVCRSLGGKTQFQHPNGVSGPYYLLNR